MIFLPPKPKKKSISKLNPEGKIIAVDFDGVIHDFKHPIEGRRMGAPIEGAKEALIELKNRNYKIVIFTVWGDRAGQQTISDFMDYYGLPFDEITNIKPNAVAYIDDKGIKFTNWIEVLNQI